MDQLRSERILLAEDEAGIRGLIQLYLENHGYEICTVDSGVSEVF